VSGAPRVTIPQPFEEHYHGRRRRRRWLEHRGILVFLLIFGLGNVILYYTTGIVLIPIK
jgi:hypothetical protein